MLTKINRVVKEKYKKNKKKYKALDIKAKLLYFYYNTKRRYIWQFI
jgi:hypothetical protein